MRITVTRTAGTFTATLVAAALLMGAAQDSGTSPAGPDAAAYGSAEGYPAGTRANAFEQKFMVSTFSHFDSLFPSRAVSPAAQPWNFSRPTTPPAITYVHHGEHYSLSDYLAHLPVTGLLIAKDDQIFAESYQYGRSGQDRFTSQSMAKSIVAMLSGIALAAHPGGSVADAASKYVPELKNTPYGAVTLRNLLHMQSGVTCRLPEEDPGAIDVKTLEHGCQVTAPQGTRFKYSPTDSEALGLVVQRLAGMPLARYLQEKIWREIGTEEKATWTLDAGGNETPFCCFNATLRDYARFARLLAYDGAWNGKQLIPRQWVLDATTVAASDPQLAPGAPALFFGYGYQTWIFPGPRRMFALLGANGQRIFVDPQSKLIMVQTAVMVKDMDPPKDAEMIGLWLSLVHRYRSE